MTKGELRDPYLVLIVTLAAVLLSACHIAPWCVSGNCAPCTPGPNGSCAGYNHISSLGARPTRETEGDPRR